MSPIDNATTSEGLHAGDAAVLHDLLEAVPGLAIYSRSHPQYNELRAIDNLAFTQAPLAVVRPANAAQVSGVVRFAQEKKLSFGVRNRGHDLAGRSMRAIDSGIMLDIRLLDWVRVDEDKTFAHVGGGVQAAYLVEELQARGFVSPTGLCNAVGYAGWALGGGYGVLSAKFGLGVDQILGASVVLASGELVDTDDHPELLWALRGAGNGTLGVVVELRVKIYKSPTVLGGVLGFAWSDVTSVIGKYSEIQEELPENFAGDSITMVWPGIGPVWALYFAWIPDSEDLETGYEFLGKMRKLGSPVVDTVEETTISSFLSKLLIPRPREVFLRSWSIEHFRPEMAEAVARARPAGFSGIVMHQAHGAAIRPNPNACFAVRKRHQTNHALGHTASGAPASWADDVAEDFRSRFAIPETYASLSPPGDVDTIATYGGEQGLWRLREVKKRYDPENVFSRGYPELA